MDESKAGAAGPEKQQVTEQADESSSASEEEEACDKVVATPTSEAVPEASEE